MRPVDKGQAREDDIRSEEVVGVGEEARGGYGPNLPVEAIAIDITADLLSLVVVGLGKLCQRSVRVGVAEQRVSLTSWCRPTSVGLIQTRIGKMELGFRCLGGYMKR